MSVFSKKAYNRTADAVRRSIKALHATFPEGDELTVALNAIDVTIEQLGDEFESDSKAFDRERFINNCKGILK